MRYGYYYELACELNGLLKEDGGCLEAPEPLPWLEKMWQAGLEVTKWARDAFLSHGAEARGAPGGRREVEGGKAKGPMSEA